jgi:hypothetical protein
MKSLPNPALGPFRPAICIFVTLLVALVPLFASSCRSSSPTTVSSNSAAPKATIATCAAMEPIPPGPGPSMPLSVVDFVSHLTETDPTIGGIWSDGVTEVLNISFTRDEQVKRDALVNEILPWKLNALHADFSHGELWSVQQSLTDRVNGVPNGVRAHIGSVGIDERRNRVVLNLLDLSAPVVVAVTEAIAPQPTSVCIDPVQQTPAFPA